MDELRKHLEPQGRGPKSGPGRHTIESGRSKSEFSRNAAKTHYKNLPSRCPMRGGIRL